MVGALCINDIVDVTKRRHVSKYVTLTLTFSFFSSLLLKHGGTMTNDGLSRSDSCIIQ